MRAAAPILMLLASLTLPACRGTLAPGEAAMRESVDRVSALYRPDERLPDLPALTPEAAADYVRYAVLRSPQVERRFHEWRAAVEEITVARSLPDPQITLGASLSSMLSVLMGALQATSPPSGSLIAAAIAQREQAAAQQAMFQATAVEVAAETWTIYHEAALLEETLAINEEIARLLAELQESVETSVQVGRASQQDLLRIGIERDDLHYEIRSLEDTRNVVRARLRRSLGIPPRDSDPPLPARFPDEEPSLPEEDMVERVLEADPELKARRAEILEAAALADLARSTASPEWMFSAGSSTASPLMVTPEIGFTLPIWEDKIRATIAGAQARQHAAASALEAAKLARLVDLAEWLFLWRDAGRRLELAGESQLPKSLAALEIARVEYVTGRADLTALLDAERMVRRFRIAQVRARADRESAWSRIVLQLMARWPLAAARPVPAEEAP